MLARCGWFGVLLGCCIAFNGCGRSGEFGTAKTTGVVICDGKPVVGAMVYFEPIASAGAKSALVGKQGFSYTDDAGRFDISTYNPGKGDGAVVGMHRVRVGRGKAVCDCAMNSEVDLMQVEVKQGETNEFELQLKKATLADKKAEERNRDDDEDD